MTPLYYKAPGGNFGDDLNQWLWPRLIPDFSSLLPSSVFVGIGTILDQRIPRDQDVAILGTGYRPQAASFSIAPNWKVYGVRGHLTTDALGLPGSLAIGDPAHLITTVANFPSSGESSLVGLVPHYSSLQADENGWNQCADRCDLELVSPCNDVDVVVSEIAKCDRILTESLHGAIVAETLRIPWLCFRSTTRHSEGMEVNNFKWQDWCSTLSISHQPLNLPMLWAASGILGNLRRSVKIQLLCKELRKARDSSRFQLSKTVILEQRIQMLSDAVGTFIEEATQHGF